MIRLCILVFLVFDVNSASIDDLFDISNPKFFFPKDGQSKIDFGFSIALFNNNESLTLLVGAPRANTSQEGVLEPGALYACDLDKLKENNLCYQLIVDSRNAEDKYSSFINQDAKNYQRLGASVVSHNNHIVVCAPNWHYYEVRTNAVIDTPVGTCFESWSLDNFKQFSVPFDLYGDRSIDYLKTGSCQSGFSAAHMSNDEVALGSPGCYNWQGDVFVGSKGKWSEFGKNFTQANIGGAKDEKIWMSNHYLGYSVAHGTFNQLTGIVSGSPRSTHSPTKIEFSDGKKLEIVIPMVNIFLKKNKWLQLWTSLTPPTDAKGAEWLFSYFGYAVAVADVDNNGLDDVIIGAPYYHNRSIYDQGAVLVYLQKRILKPDSSDHIQMIPEDIENIRVGSLQNARFGSCISAIGDIDGDKIQDIAVGAPHSNDGGRVYIFLGSKNGLQITADYFLSASHFYFKGKRLSGFGVAIAPALIISDSVQSDIGVGAVDSDAVIIFQSKEMLILDWHINFENKMDLSSKCAFNHIIQPCTSMKICLDYRFQPSSKALDTRPKEFELSYILDSNYHRLYFENGKSTQSRTIFVEFEKITCYVDKVYTTRQIDNFEVLPVIGQVKHIRNKWNDKSSLHHTQVTEKTENLEIVIDCHSNDVGQCKSDLRLQTQTNVSPTSAVLIDDLKFTITFELTKRSQPSYSTALMIKTDKFMELSGKASIYPESTFQSLVDCRKYNKGRFKCYLGNFLNEHDLLKFNLTFISSDGFLKIENIRHRHHTINVKSHVKSLSQIMNPEAVIAQNEIRLAANPEILLTKDDSTEFVAFNDSSYFVSPEKADDEEDKIGPKILHTFKIYNPKNYIIENILLTMYWPLEILDKQSPLMVRNYVSSTPASILGRHSCHSTENQGLLLTDMSSLPMVENITWSITHCLIVWLKPKRSILIHTESRIVMTTLKQDIASESFDQIGSFIILEANPILLDNEILILHKNHIFTVIHYKEVNFGKITWWMIAIAVGIAIFLIALIVYALSKCNFFKRKKTAELGKEHLTLDQQEEPIEEQEMEPFEIHESQEQYDNVS